MEPLEVSKNKRPLEFTEERVGTHNSAKREREEPTGMGTATRKAAAKG